MVKSWHSLPLIELQCQFEIYAVIDTDGAWSIDSKFPKSNFLTTVEAFRSIELKLFGKLDWSLLWNNISFNPIQNTERTKLECMCVWVYSLPYYLIVEYIYIYIYICTTNKLSWRLRSLALVSQPVMKKKLWRSVIRENQWHSGAPFFCYQFI